MSDIGALAQLLKLLDRRGYEFITPTPATHARVIARRQTARPGNLRDVFGWSLPFETLDPDIEALLEQADMIEQAGDARRSAVRVSRLHGELFLHSAYPTEDKDSIFFGPDSYRFADFILREASGAATRIVDIGAGAGVGAIVAASTAPDARITLTDLNAGALRFATINAAHAGRDVEGVETSGIAGVEGPIDLILANPPYMMDDGQRTYRDGGGLLGAELSATWAQEGVERLEPGGRMLLYSGSAIVDGRDVLKEALQGIEGAALVYREIDPDVFGEELDKPAYAEADRIAIIGAVLTKE